MPLLCQDIAFPRNPQVLTPRARRLLRAGQYERKEAQALRRLLRPGDRVLELGGGLGFLSSLAVSLGAGAVTVVEANPDLIPYITRVHAANQVAGITVLNGLAAASDGPRREFYLRQNFLASSLDPDPALGPLRRVVAVEQLGLPRLLQESGADILICDIEGAEDEVLSATDLGQLRAAIIELHPQWIGTAGVDRVFQTFHRAGLSYAARASEGKVVGFERITHPAS